MEQVQSKTWRRRLADSVPAVLLAALGFLASQGPDEATTNLAAWAKAVGLAAWPSWLTATSIFGVAIPGVGFFYAWRFRGAIGRAYRAVRWPALLLDHAPQAGLPASPEKQPVRTKAEEDLVADIRAIWERFGKESTESLRALFSSVYYRIRESKYWAECMAHHEEEFAAARDLLNTALADRSVPLADVRKRFGEMYTYYRRLMKWLAEIVAAGDLPIDGEDSFPYAARLERWRERHRAFRDKLQDLVTRPEHVRTLAIFYRDPLLLDEPYRSFLRESGEFDS